MFDGSIGKIISYSLA